MIHVSQLSHKFVNDAREVVKAGDIVRVKVLEVDLQRQRISLTMKMDTQVPLSGAAAAGRSLPKAGLPQRESPVGGAMAAAFAKLRGKP